MINPFKVGNKVRHKSANVEWWWQYFCKANKCSPTGVYTIRELVDAHLRFFNVGGSSRTGNLELVEPKKKRKVI